MGQGMIAETVDQCLKHAGRILRVREGFLDFLPAGKFHASPLRDKGKPIPTNDIWIAASAMQHGLALATLGGPF